MLALTNLNKETEIVTNLKEFTRKKMVNGEKTISFVVIPDASNEHSYHLVDTESRFKFDGEEYIIKNVVEQSVGEKTVKKAEAVHVFFNDMINFQQHKIHNGSMTFNAALNFVFENTDYNYVMVDGATAEQFENFGKENCLALFKKVLERYGMEFYVIGKTVYLKREIGVKTDFQFRYRLNIRSIEKDIDTSKLATVIRGYAGEPDDNGVYPIEEEYISPNINYIGRLETDPYTSENMLAERLRSKLKEVLIDEPQVSLKIDFVDLRASGYNQGAPSEGDYGHIIYEPMNDLNIEARIVEIEEEYNGRLEPIRTSVIISNIRETATKKMTRFQQTQRKINDLFEGKERLPYSVLDEAVRMATEAIQSAQTELIFDNGILAFEKPNPNEVVILNSKGLGISRNGGQTLTTAITSRGVVAETIVGGSIIGINLASDNGLGTFHVSGSDAEFSSPSGTMKMNPDGIYSFNKNGTTKFQADSFLVTSRALGTTTANVYLAAQSGKEARVVDMKDVPSDGEIGSYTYIPVRGQGFYGNYLEANAGEAGFNVYIRPRNGGEVRVTGANTTDVYYPLRASAFYGSSFVSTTSSAWIGTDSFLHVVAKGSAEGSLDPIYRDLRAARIYGTGFVTSSTHAYIGSDDEVRFQNKGLSGIYRNARANLYYGNGVEVNGGTNLYLRPSSSGEVQVTAAGTTDSYKTIRAAGFVEASSQEYKTDITPWNYDALSVLRNETQIYQYKMISDVEQGNSFYRRGVIVERETPAEFINGKGVSHYEMINFVVRALQQLGDKFDDLDYRVTKLEGAS